MKRTLTLAFSLLFMLGAAASAQTVIRYLQPGVDQPNLRAPVEAMIEQFEAQYPDIRVELESVGWNDAYQKITTDMLANKSAGVIYSGSRSIPAFSALGGIVPMAEYVSSEQRDMFPEAVLAGHRSHGNLYALRTAVIYIGARWIPAFSALGVIVPMEEYVSSEKLDMFPEALLDGHRFQGNLYALPIAFSTKVLYYRTDLMDRAPTTWEELLSEAQRITAQTDAYGIGIPGAAHVGTVQQFQAFLHQAGGSFFDEDGRVNLETEEAHRALQFYADLYLEHEVTPNPIEFNREELPTLFGEGRIAMHINGPWARTIMGIEPDNEQYPYAVAVLPCDARCGGVLGADSVAISTSSENKEAAYQFIDFMTSFEVHTERILASGLTPMLEGQSDLEEFQTPFWQPFVEMVDVGFPEAQPLAWEPFEQIINDMIQSVLLGNQSVDDALTRAAAQIRDQQLEPAASN